MSTQVASAPLVEHLLLLPPLPPHASIPPPPPPPPPPIPHRPPPIPRSTAFTTDLSWSDGGIGEAVASKVEEYEMEFNKVSRQDWGEGPGGGRGVRRGEGPH